MAEIRSFQQHLAKVEAEKNWMTRWVKRAYKAEASARECLIASMRKAQESWDDMVASGETCSEEEAERFATAMKAAQDELTAAEIDWGGQ